jgi:chromosome segregation ATPase
MESLNLNEASKLNPGKNAIKASLLGSKSASALVKTAQAALKQWPSLNREKKKEIYAKLAELKKAARENMRAEIKGAKPEQKTAAAEKATQLYSSFVAAVKKREKAESSEEEKETKVDVSALEKERDEIKDWLVNAQDKLMKAIEGKSEEDAYKIALKMQDEAIAKANKYNDLIAKIEDANKSNEAYKILTEWFDILLEFDADKVVDKIKDKVENIEKKVEGGEDSEEEPEEEEDDDAKRDALLDELDELEEQDRDLESELDDADSERKDAIAAYNDAAAKHKEAKDSGADQDTLYDLDDAEYEAEEKKGYAIDDYNRAKSRIGKEREEIAKKIKEVNNKLKELKPRKNESRIVMTFDNFITERYGS